MNPNLQMCIMEIQSAMDDYENELISYITDEMNTNNFKKFYKDNNIYVFEDSDGEVQPIGIELDMTFGLYDEIMERPNIIINL